jgi:hypothetical protein
MNANFIIQALVSLDKIELEEKRISKALSSIFHDFQGFTNLSSIAESCVINTMASAFEDKENVTYWIEWYLYDRPTYDTDGQTSLPSNVQVDSKEYFIYSHQQFADFLLKEFKLNQYKD